MVIVATTKEFVACACAMPKSTPPRHRARLLPDNGHVCNGVTTMATRCPQGARRGAQGHTRWPRAVAAVAVGHDQEARACGRRAHSEPVEHACD